MANGRTLGRLIAGSPTPSFAVDLSLCKSNHGKALVRVTFITTTNRIKRCFIDAITNEFFLQPVQG